jgi:hypothetical protein
MKGYHTCRDNVCELTFGDVTYLRQWRRAMIFAEHGVNGVYT